MFDISEAYTESVLGRVPQYASYLQFVKQCLSVNPEYEWLHRFLAHPSPETSETQVTIFDAVDRKLVERGPFSSCTGDFDDILASYPARGSFRLINVTYSNVWTVNRSILDKLGMDFDIDPSFFRRHFQHSKLNDEDAVVRDEWEKPRRWPNPMSPDFRLLPSEESLVEYHFSSKTAYNRMSVLLCSNLPMRGGSFSPATGE